MYILATAWGKTREDMMHHALGVSMQFIHKDFLAIIALSFIVAVNQFYLIPHEVLSYGTSATYPYLLNGMMAAFTLCYLGEALRRRRLKTDGPSRIPLNLKAMCKPLLLLLCIWLWVDGCETVGFLLSSMGLLAAACLLYGERSPKGIALLSVCVPLGILLFFAALRSVLPEGPLDAWILSLLRR